MPTYQYVCSNPDGKHEFEVVQSFTDAPVSECTVCAASVRKVYGSVGVVFKGSGFYRTDSRAGAASSAGSSAKSGESSSSSDGSSSDGSSSNGSSSNGSSSNGSSSNGSSSNGSSSGSPTPSSSSSSSSGDSKAAAG